MNKSKAVCIMMSFAVLFILSCKQGGGTNGPNAEKQAKSFCECAKPAVEISGKLASISPDEREGLIKESQKALQDALQCLNKQEVTKKMLEPEKAKVWETQYKAAVKKNCPEAVKALNLSF